MNQNLIETHPLPPFLPQDMQLLILGSFPPPQNKWKMNFYYPNYQNDMWRIMGALFFNDKEYFLDIDQKQFKLDKIQAFLCKMKIGIYDTAYQIKRLKGNASDQFLEIITPSPIDNLLQKFPTCTTLLTTGEKATTTLMTHFPMAETPSIQKPTHAFFEKRSIKLFRLPSTSRAYPLAFNKKVEAYQRFFQKIGML